MVMKKCSSKKCTIKVPQEENQFVNQRGGSQTSTCLTCRTKEQEDERRQARRTIYSAKPKPPRAEPEAPLPGYKFCSDRKCKHKDDSGSPLALRIEDYFVGEGNGAQGVTTRSCKDCRLRNKKEQQTLRTNRKKTNVPIAKDYARDAVMALRRLSQKRGIEWSLGGNGDAEDPSDDPVLKQTLAMVMLPCFYCKRVSPSGYQGIDRVVASGIYEPGNVVSACKPCNCMKMCLDPVTFKERCARITGFTASGASLGHAIIQDAFGATGEFEFESRSGSTGWGAGGSALAGDLSVDPGPPGSPSSSASSAPSASPPPEGGDPRTPVAAYRKSAAARGIPFELDDEQVARLMQGVCSYCGDSGGGIDRVRSQGPYREANAVSCCGACNYMKGNLSARGFLEAARLVATEFDPGSLPFDAPRETDVVATRARDVFRPPGPSGGESRFVFVQQEGIDLVVQGMEVERASKVTEAETNRSALLREAASVLRKAPVGRQYSNALGIKYASVHGNGIEIHKNDFRWSTITTVFAVSRASLEESALVLEDPEEMKREALRVKKVVAQCVSERICCGEGVTKEEANEIQESVINAQGTIFIRTPKVHIMKLSGGNFRVDSVPIADPDGSVAHTTLQTNERRVALEFSRARILGVPTTKSVMFARARAESDKN